ncbi:MAG: tRNA 2-selenouridine(34) synthase MnmH [Ramlibacter sp.]|nr:tRNA 2-selenouridine(34) synthase MnmH [Ramlibacter sp.]
MSEVRLSAAEAVLRLGEFSAVIDARSESEYALDHLPGAVNWPSLNDAQRIEVGTIYKQVNPFEARKRGAALVAANVSAHITREVMDKPKHWRPLVYCWRGGQRSGALALVLGQIGFRVHLVDGGYKAFRGAVLQHLPELAQRLQLRVICGPTGSGKTRLLHALASQGAQVLDLEGLANHRSSVLGSVPGLAQPSQKRFDTLVWDTLRHFDPARPVFVESESRKVGDVAINEALMTAMRASPCLRLSLPEDERVALLLEDYAQFVHDPQLLCSRLEALVELRGKATVASWTQRVRAGQLEPVVRELLALHYDPGYERSSRNNFSQFDAAKLIAPEDHTSRAMTQLAQKIQQEENP